VADLFSGARHPSPSPSPNAEVHAVVGDVAMLGPPERLARSAPGLHRVATEARDLFRRPLDPAELRGFDAAVIDPPRAGAEAQVAELARARLPVVTYVSCNPASFARDARALLAAGYRMAPITVVDQFRWSAHVELATRFSLA
jgi:23S rRNA (uracil1939-C5)-methyltransferase